MHPAPASASTAVAAACFRARLAGEPGPAGERTARVLAGYRRTAGDRGRGQARPFGAADLAAVLATCHQSRRRGRGRESEKVALERGRLDAVIAGLLFMAGMRRSEVSALRWADVAAAADGDGVLVTVRRGKTNQEGETTDVRFVKGGVARAIRTLRAAASPATDDRVVPLSSKMVGLRFQEYLATILGQATPDDAPALLDEWLEWAARSRLTPFVKLGRTIRKHAEGILAYLDTKMTNGPVEGINNKLRVIARRAYGFHSPGALISMLFLCCGGIELAPPLPTRI